MTSNTVLKLMIDDNVDLKLQAVIQTKIETFLKSGQYKIVFSSLYKLIDDFKFHHIPKMLLEIVKVVLLLKLKISLSRYELKYFFFAILTEFITAEYPDFFASIQEDTYIQFYDGVYDALNFVPDELGKIKPNCNC